MKKDWSRSEGKLKKKPRLSSRLNGSANGMLITNVRGGYGRHNNVRHSADTDTDRHNDADNGSTHRTRSRGKRSELEHTPARAPSSNCRRAGTEPAPNKQARARKPEPAGRSLSTATAAAVATEVKGFRYGSPQPERPWRPRSQSRIARVVFSYNNIDALARFCFTQPQNILQFPCE